MRRTVFPFGGLLIVAAVTLFTNFRAAEGQTAVSLAAPSSALGSDMWTGLADRRGLFRPHSNTCDATEAFVAVGGTTAGYCIEKDERASAPFEVAREACTQAGKRLPEPGEYKFACNKAATLGLNNMTTTPEWSSNFLSPMLHNTGMGASVAATAGIDSCERGSFGWVTREDGSPADSTWYRCVR